MNRDQEIASRFREGREEANLSQASLAHALSLTRDQIANIETGKAVLRAEVANRYCEFLGISQRWLATGGEPSFPFVRLPVELPCPTNFAPDGSFAQLYDAVLSQHCDGYFSAGLDAIERQLRLVAYVRPAGASRDTPATEARVLWSAIRDLISYMMAVLPPSLYAGLWVQIQRSCLEFMSGSGKTISDHGGASAKADQSAASVVRAGVELELAALRADDFRVDRLQETVNSVPVTLTWEETIELTKAVTTEPGSKGKLADKLGVPQSRLSEWLSGKYEPGAEVAFRLAAEVVGLKKAKSKSVASVPASATPTASKKNKRDESPKSKPRKRSHKDG